MLKTLRTTFCFLCLLIAGVSSAWGQELKVDFESALSEYADWTFSNVERATGISASTGSWHGTTGGKTTAYAQTKSKIEKPTSLTFYYTKKSGNKNTSSLFKIQVSSDGSSWTDVASGKTMNNVTEESWESLTADLSSYSNVYVRVYYTGTTAVRALDDITLTYTSAAVSSLSIDTAPTKTEYKVGETLDLTGLVLNADGTDVTSGYTASPANGATLAAAGTQTVSLTYGGKTVSQTIYVGELSGIAVTTAPTKTAYDEGQSFDPAGMVVKATYDTGDGHTWEETVDDYDYTPNTALSPSNTFVTISYGGKTTTQEITVTAGVPYTVSFNAGTGACGTSSLAEASFGAGVTLPTATIGLSGWSFAGWAEAAVENTQVAPTFYAAGETYHPTDDITLYAVYKYVNNGDGVFKRATSLSDITSASSVVIVSNSQSKVLDTTIGQVTAPTETSSKITAPDAAIFTLTGNNTDGYTLTNGTTTIGASSTNNSTVITNTATNSLWVVKAHNTSNTFYFENTAKSNLCLEYYSDSWMVYAPSTPKTNAAVSMKVYVPNVQISYNSNPAAMINPTVAFTTSGDKALYVQDESSYTNVANVTGIAKAAVYTSSNTAVATVDANGEVTALKSGSAIITATVEAEVGVNTEATATYNVTVKDAKTIAGIKAITDGSSAKSFTADLTDAVVTYVKGKHAYIQDATGGIYASCGDDLTAGKKINGAVSGSVKAAYKIDEITAIDLTEATVTDGVVPAAEVKTLAQIKDAGTEYEGKLVTVNAATVTAALNTGSASGGKISDDAKTTEMNLYAPDENIEALKDAEGNFTGFISIYNAETYRLNIYEQSQIVLTKNAPTAQALTFAEDAIELDEETSAFDAFTGQTVSGAQGTVTYALTGDAIGEVNASTGAVTLNGTRGTATITATAAAKEVTEAGVTTPYTETVQSYTITVRPRYTVTFSVNGVENELREASYGAGVAVPANPSAIGDYKFQGWSTATVAKTDTKPALASIEAGDTYVPADDETIYAVFAVETMIPNVEETSTFSFQSTTPESPYVVNEGTWTWTSITQGNSTDKSVGLKKNLNQSITFTPSANVTSIKSVSVTKTAQSWGDATLTITDATPTEIASFNRDAMPNGDQSSEGTKEVDLTSHQSSSYTIANNTGANAWIKNISFTYTVNKLGYAGYTTSLSETVAISAAGLATYASDYALDYTNVEGIEAYIAKEEAGTVKLHQVNKVPAGTGVLLRSTNSGTEFVVPITTAATDDVTGNAFVRGAGATVASQVGDKYNYILNIVDEVLGFYKANGNMVATNRAYLQTSVASARIALDFDDETTGIKSMDNGQWTMDNVYDMQGRKVDAPKKGLYIINGRKVVIK